VPELERPIRVLYVHHRSEGGGAPRSLALLIAALGDRVEPFVLSPDGRAADAFRAAGAGVATAPIASFTHSWASWYAGARWLLLASELARMPGHYRALRGVIARARPDLVHLNDSPLWPAAHLAARQGLPVVWHLRAALPATGARAPAACREYFQTRPG
jgi:hypothetical protein